VAGNHEQDGGCRRGNAWGRSLERAPLPCDAPCARSESAPPPSLILNIVAGSRPFRAFVWWAVRSVRLNIVAQVAVWSVPAARGSTGGAPGITGGAPGSTGGSTGGSAGGTSSGAMSIGGCATSWTARAPACVVSPGAPWTPMPSACRRASGITGITGRSVEAAPGSVARGQRPKAGEAAPVVVSDRLARPRRRTHLHHCWNSKPLVHPSPLSERLRKMRLPLR
jgi:hypothetical protein